MKNDRAYIIHTRDGVKRITAEDARQNAKRQQQEGVKPSFCYRFGGGEYGRPGFLIWSTREDGAGVYIPADDDITGGYISTGWQGDFAICPPQEATA